MVDPNDAEAFIMLGDSLKLKKIQRVGTYTLHWDVGWLNLVR